MKIDIIKNKKIVTATFTGLLIAGAGYAFDCYRDDPKWLCYFNCQQMADTYLDSCYNAAPFIDDYLNCDPDDLTETQLEECAAHNDDVDIQWNEYYDHLDECDRDYALWMNECEEIQMNE